MEYTNIKFKIENGIAHLILARDDIRNAFSEKNFSDEIVDAIERTQLSEEARVLVLSAEGSAFSAGGNIKDMKDKKGIFGMVDVKYLRDLKRDVTLREIKDDLFFSNFPLVKQARLSVMPVTKNQWNKLIKMSNNEKKGNT